MAQSPTMGGWIARRRQDAGLTQKDLGTKLGVSQQAVGKWETGRTAPGYEMLRPLRDALGVSNDDMLAALGLADERRPKRPDVEAAIAADVRLSAEQKALLVDVYRRARGRRP